MAGSQQLATFAGKMSTKYGREKITNGPPPVIVSTGSVAMDRALRIGGYQLGRVYEVLGPKDSGKSTLGIAGMVSFAEAFPDRGYCYINMENTFDPARSTAMGLDCSAAAMRSGRWAPMMPEHSEDVSDMARDYCGSGLYSIIVVDSIGAMESDRVLGKDAAKAADAVGRNAKIITQMTKALSTMARLNNCTIVLINQPRANIGGFGGNDVSAGPKAMQHSTTAKIEMRGLGGEDDVRKLKLPGEEDLITVSIRTRMRVTRMKNGLPGRVAESFVNRVATAEFGPPGFDVADEYITVGVREKVISLGGAWYTLPDGSRFQGRDKLARHLRENPDARKAIRGAIVFDTPTDILEGDA